MGHDIRMENHCDLWTIFSVILPCVNLRHVACVSLNVYVVYRTRPHVAYPIPD